MEIEEILSKYEEKFENGDFLLKKDEEMSKTLCRERGVPNKPGVYLIYSVKEENRELLRIGKAGTLHQDGTFSKQKLIGRLNKEQEGMPRRKYFNKKMEEMQLDGLFFRWFVTFDKEKGVRTIPAKAEAELLQSFFNEQGELPAWNKEL